MKFCRQPVGEQIFALSAPFGFAPIDPFGDRSQPVPSRRTSRSPCGPICGSPSRISSEPPRTARRDRSLRRVVGALQNSAGPDSASAPALLPRSAVTSSGSPAAPVPARPPSTCGLARAQHVAIVEQGFADQSQFPFAPHRRNDRHAGIRLGHNRRAAPLARQTTRPPCDSAHKTGIGVPSLCFSSHVQRDFSRSSSCALRNVSTSPHPFPGIRCNSALLGSSCAGWGSPARPTAIHLETSAVSGSASPALR